MIIGDVVQKVRGWGANRREGPIIGLIVGFNMRKPRGASEGIAKVPMKRFAIVATDGYIEEWVADFCEVIHESR